MATTNAKLAKWAGGRDVWGGRGVYLVNYTGPTSYQGGAGGGDLIIAIGGTTQLGASNTPLRNIDTIIPSGTVSGTYTIEVFPTAKGPTKRWLLRWFTAAGATEVTNTTNLSAETAILVIVGG